MKKLLIIVMIVAIGCNTEKQISLSDDNTIKTVFDSSEINDLLKIQYFFDKSIGMADNKSQTDLIKVYSDFFKLNSEIMEVADIKLPIDFNNQKKLYNQIDQKTFDEIWKFGWSIKMNSTDTLKHLDLNRRGKYVEFLKSLEEKDSIVNNYYNSLEAAGDISPSMVADLVKNYDNYDIKDPKIRLMIAIHYLTLNDKFERKEKY